jgi:acyl transferase domain-containing protein
MRNPRLTLQFTTRTLARLRHVTKKLEPNTLAYILVKQRAAKPAHLEHLAQYLADTVARMRELTEGKRRRLSCWTPLPESSRWGRCYCSPRCRQRAVRSWRALEARHRSAAPEAARFVTRSSDK